MSSWRMGHTKHTAAKREEMANLAGQLVQLYGAERLAVAFDVAPSTVGTWVSGKTVGTAATREALRRVLVEGETALLRDARNMVAFLERERARALARAAQERAREAEARAAGTLDAEGGILVTYAQGMASFVHNPGQVAHCEEFKAAQLAERIAHLRTVVLGEAA